MAGYWNNSGATPQKVTWKNPQIIPENKRQSGGWYYNPASGYIERWWKEGTGPGSTVTTMQQTPTQQTYQPQTADEMMQSLKNVVNQAIEPQVSAEKKLGEYMERNPFKFDEILAKASAEERFNPYYDAELKDYITGVERTKSRSKEDEEKLRQELSLSAEKYVGRTKRDIDSAIEASGEGFAGAGLFASGRRVREGAMVDIKGQENIADLLHETELKKQESEIRQQRTLEDLASQQGTYERRLGSEKETALLSDIATQKRQAANKYLLGATQYAGAPLSSNTTILNNLLGV